MSRVSDILDDFYDPVRYHFIDRSRRNPNVDIPLLRTFRCYKNADDYLHPRVSYGKSESDTNVNENAFEECIDVQHFKPEEISVKVEKNSILVHAKHAEKKDEQGFISREFTRRYELPIGCKSEDVVSSLSSDGILAIKCVAAPVIELKEERQVPITQTHKPAQSSDKSKAEDAKETPVA
ncbi:Heat shock protein 23 [Pseudolycoriella hygida]|uniref:Heat shock protein 23 n=1 Tax=Pseudolycoriella hygida TaxID=35572 RepID=A0A9Q0RV15_9DIPT|nr:Heat shock protein 23 [Pseudolycoriella hygida]